MCGRIIDIRNDEIYRKRFNAEFKGDPWVPRFNLAPSQLAPVILDSEPDTIQRAYWGFRPTWLKDKGGRELINARAETLAEKATFRKSFESKRCLVIADGFYEWQRDENKKIPYLIRRADQRPFVMAGLWTELNHERIGPIPSFVIITVEPNKIMQPIHSRMPAIFSEKNERTWLNPEIEIEEAQFLLTPFDEPLTAVEVSTIVNSPANDTPANLQPV